ncbi:MAG: hypothetical protein VCA55_05095 [Verrucomicrobiales bacterium]
MFAAIPLACIAHIACAVFFGGQQQWPVVELVVIAAAVIALLRMLVAARPFRWRLLVLNICGWLLAAGFLWWTQVYSSYPKMSAKISVGENVAGLLTPVDMIQREVTPAVPADDAAGTPDTEPGPIRIKLAPLEEEETFLDASGKSFQLTPAPVTRRGKITATAPVKSARAKKLEPPAFLDKSDATLVVFFRGWW